MKNPLRTRPNERWPNLRQAFVLLFGGILLAIGGCAGWLTSFASRYAALRVLSYSLGIVFFAGMLTIFIGLGLGVIVFVKFLASMNRGSE
jgi:hypothetical protein